MAANGKQVTRSSCSLPKAVADGVSRSRERHELNGLAGTLPLLPRIFEAPQKVKSGLSRGPN